MSALSDAERAILLIPCTCGHDLNYHGAMGGCWPCFDIDGKECSVVAETLIAAGVERIVAGRVAAEREAGRLAGLAEAATLIRAAAITDEYRGPDGARWIGTHPERLGTVVSVLEGGGIR